MCASPHDGCMVADTHAQLTYWVELLCHVISLRLPGVSPQWRRAKQMVGMALHDFVTVPQSPISTSTSISPTEASDTKLTRNVSIQSSSFDIPVHAVNVVPPLDAVHATIDGERDDGAPKGRRRAANTKLNVSKVEVSPSSSVAYEAKIGEEHATNEWQSLMNQIDQLHSRIALLSITPRSSSSKDTEKNSTLQLSCLQWIFAQSGPPFVDVSLIILIPIIHCRYQYHYIKLSKPSLHCSLVCMDTPNGLFPS
jgi:hypothetical protein